MALFLSAFERSVRTLRISIAVRNIVDLRSPPSSDPLAERQLTIAEVFAASKKCMLSWLRAVPRTLLWTIETVLFRTKDEEIYTTSIFLLFSACWCSVLPVVRFPRGARLELRLLVEASSDWF